MSDWLNESYEDMKEHSRLKKESNKRFSTDELIRNNISFESKNFGTHLIITHGSFTVDFWPSTGKFIVRGLNKKGRGVFNLLKFLGVKK